MVGECSKVKVQKRGRNLDKKIQTVKAKIRNFDSKIESVNLASESLLPYLLLLLLLLLSWVSGVLLLLPLKITICSSPLK
jgi:hypothetical protein